MKFLASFKGKKTYIVATLLVLGSLGHVLNGDMSVLQFLNSPDVVVFLNGLGLASLRASVSNILPQ